MSDVKQGHVITLVTTFLDAPGGSPIDPTDIALSIEFDGEPVYGPYAYPGGILKNDVGLYRYQFTVPADAALGSYTAKWSGVIAGDTRFGYEEFDVTEAGSGEVAITVEDVQDWLGSTRPTDTSQLELVVIAANAFVNDNTDDTMAPHSTRVMGAIMLAGRWYGRRSSTTGIQTFDQFGPTYVSRYDSDITRLLGLNAVAVG